MGPSGTYIIDNDVPTKFGEHERVGTPKTSTSTCNNDHLAIKADRQVRLLIQRNEMAWWCAVETWQNAHTGIQGGWWGYSRCGLIVIGHCHKPHRVVSHVTHVTLL